MIYEINLFFFQASLRNCINCVHCDDHFFIFISWFISYIINTHFFHGNIWTHNWPAPNVSGFIAQLAEHRTGNREVTGSNPLEVLNFFEASLRNWINCVHCDDHFFIFTSATVAKNMDTWQVGQQLNGASPVTIPEIIVRRILAPITFSFLSRCRGSLRRRRNLTSVSNVCEAAPLSLFCAPSKLNELPEMHFVFSFNLTVKSTMAFFTRQ